MQQNQAANQMRVSTQIRNFYSPNVSYMNTKFYNTSFMITLYPFAGQDQNGRSKYDMNTYVSSTVGAEGVYALYHLCNEIIDGKIQDVHIAIPCFNGEITLDRKSNGNGYSSTLSLNKNNSIINFVFPTTSYTVMENGMQKTVIAETGLGAFMKTLEGFLVGINADRHLDKLTDEYVKLLNGNDNNQQQPANNNPKPQWNNNNNNQKRYYNNNQKRYPQQNNQRQYNNQPKQNNWGGANQGFDNYNVPG